MRFCKIIFVLINFTLVFAFDGQIIFPKNDTLHLNSICVIKSPANLNARGICTKLNDCFAIDNQIRKSNYNHTVCGYERKEQIVCCPQERAFGAKLLKSDPPEIGSTEINMNSDFKCTVKSSGLNGVLKFIEQCPELKGNIKDGVQDFCNHEVCKNLVCCPLPKPSLRYNPVCANVDRPDTEIRYRLDVNTPCTVKGLNVTGTYQNYCDAYNRKEITSENVLSVCTGGLCDTFYCCPILTPSDNKYCTRRGKAEFSRIEFIGPKCTDSLTNLPGRCRDLYDCPAFRRGRQKLDECGKNCCTNFYCCPEEDYVFQSISLQKCFGYKSTVYRKQVTIDVLHEMESPNTICSPIKFPYAGGIEAKPGAFPHMAALGYENKNDKGMLLWNCGGSIISETFILTAAHCLKTTEFGQVKTIRLGSLYLENVTKSDECAEDFGVKRIIPHPSYNRSFVYNDIGLIELDREVKFNFHMRPICLPASSEIPYNLFGMGWGLQGPLGDEISNTIYFANLEMYKYEECNKSYEFNLNGRSLNGIDERTQFCLGSHDTIQSTCKGDSGGPIISPLNGFDGMNEIYGVASFGTVCGFANSPGVYTKIYPYVKWIESVVWS